MFLENKQPPGSNSEQDGEFSSKRFCHLIRMHGLTTYKAVA